MFPNPQSALPLPARPDLEQYRKRAKDLVRACRRGVSEAVHAWALEWIAALADRAPASVVDEVAAYAASRLIAKPESCTLSEAQLVIARSHGFASWPKFAAHLEALRSETSPDAAFERAVDAIVKGDDAALSRLLDSRPSLVRERSSREHDATLLIYTSANGVEGYRQKSPANAAAIAERLLRAGAEVDATADVYFSQCTTLGLVATSAPPHIAGVQIPLIDVLLARGARMDRPGIAGRGNSLIRSCLANGQPEAARHLARLGAPLDLVGAAGIGRVDVVASFFDERGRLQRAAPGELAEAFGWASAYGRANVVEFLLDRGVDPNVSLDILGGTDTALGLATRWGHSEVAERLRRAGAKP